MAFNKNKVTAAAQKHTNKGQFEKAIAEYQKLLKVEPDDIRTWLKVGDLYTRMGARSEATETYMRVAEKYTRSGFHLKAVAVYKQILKLDPMLTQVYEHLSDAYIKLGLSSEALIQLEQLADLLQKLNKTDKMLSTLERMAQLDPKNVATRLRIAEHLSAENKTLEAVDHFLKACDQLKEQGRIDDFVKVAERLLFHDPGQISIAQEIAKLYLDTNQYKRALAKLQLSFMKNPRDLTTLNMLASAFRGLNQPDKAISVYREMTLLIKDTGSIDEINEIHSKILEVDPDNQMALKALGMTDEVPPPSDDTTASGPTPTPMPHDKEGDTIAEGEPKEIVAKKILQEVGVLLKYGLKDRAAEHLKKIFSAEPGNMEAREAYKDLAIQLNNIDEAVEQLFLLAEYYIVSEPPTAMNYLKEIVTLDKSNKRAPRMIAALESEFVSTAPVEEPMQEAFAIETSQIEVIDNIPIIEPEADLTKTDSTSIELSLEDFGDDENVLDETIAAQAPPELLLDDDDTEDNQATMIVSPPMLEKLTDLSSQDSKPPEIPTSYKSEPPALPTKPMVAQDEPTHVVEISDQILIDDTDLDDEDEILLNGDDTIDVTDDTILVDDEDSVSLLAPDEDEEFDLDLEQELETGDIVLESVEEIKLDTQDEISTDDLALQPDEEILITDEEEIDLDAIHVGSDEEIIFSTDDDLTSADDEVVVLDRDVTTQEDDIPALLLDTDDEIILDDDISTSTPDTTDEPIVEDEPIVIESKKEALSSALLEEDNTDLSLQVDGFKQPIAPQKTQETTATAHESEHEHEHEHEHKHDPVAQTEPAAEGGNIDEELEELEFFVNYGLMEEAESILQDLRANYSGDPRVIEAEAKLEAGREKAASREAFMEKAESGNQTTEVQTAETENTNESAPAFNSEALAEDLKSFAEDEFDDAADEIADVFNRFKEGVQQQVSDSDYSTHYDLGVAYKEMALFEDAISEFRIASADPKRLATSASMIGLCLLGLSRIDDAIIEFMKGLEADQLDTQQELGLLYELGKAYQSQNQVDDAMNCFQEIVSKEPKFADVNRRIAELKAVETNKQKITCSLNLRPNKAKIK